MLVAFLIAFVVSVVLIVALVPIAVRFGLVDKPCVRKRHDGIIPLVGGLALYLTLLVLSLLFPFWKANDGIWLLGLGMPLLLLGMADDVLGISAIKRLVVQIFCSVIAIVYCDVGIDDVGHLLPGVSGTLVMLCVPLSIISMVGVINAVNMTDGVDGLAGGLVTLSFSSLAYLAYPTYVDVSMQLLTIVAALGGFLVFNSRFFGRKHAAIFMGDSGTMFLGLAIGWYFIFLSQGPTAVVTPVAALWMFAIPLLDTLTIMTRRIRHGHSPFTADREHLHHILMLAGFGVHRTVIIILLLHLVCIFIGMASVYFKVAEWITFGLFIALLVHYYIVMDHAWKVMKRVRHFREWAGFKDRRSENRDERGRRQYDDRREACNELSEDDRRGDNNERRVKARTAAISDDA